ncbi:hypothetical protein BDN70DRAFT_67751 [Pholiota conissans]|uniref:F-box domain-containing protein n=1 Tax=Pholiota conissans TaxID=109636 RepID=A0A9P5YYF8_9AGAR|nr:hypothetical protein BDN70DRAFT_67751 [Pholiota conissans]
MTAHCRFCFYVPQDEYLCTPTDPNTCGPCKKLAEIEEKVKEIRMTLVKLESERQKLKTQANQHHDRIIHRLPREVTEEIFELCLYRDFMYLELNTVPSRYTVCVPVVISAVCRRWRDIAYSMPRLWTILPLCSQRANPRSLPEPSFVSEWLERAGTYPVSVLLRVSSEDVDDHATGMEDLEAASDILGVFIEFANCLQEFRYEGPDSLLHHIFMDEIISTNLRVLHLENRNPHCPFRPLTDMRPPFLEVLSITGNLMQALCFDWTELTEITLEHAGVSECFEALRRAPNLTKCHFKWARDSTFDPEDYSFPLPLTPIFHGELKILEITAPLYEDVLPQLLCPSLEELSLDVDDSKTVKMNVIVKFLERSGCSLQKLSFVNDASLTTSDITTMCQGIPTLKHLFMRLYNSNSSLVPNVLYAHLAEFSTVNRRKIPRYLPSLKTLHIEQDTFHNCGFIPNVFGPPPDGTGWWFEVERHRHALEFVTISVNPRSRTDALWDLVGNIGKETLPWLFKLQREGVKFKFEYGVDNKLDILALMLDKYGLKADNLHR